MSYKHFITKLALVASVLTGTASNVSGNSNRQGSTSESDRIKDPIETTSTTNVNSSADSNDSTITFNGEAVNELVKKLTSMTVADLIDNGIVNKEFFSSYKYTSEDMIEMRNNSGGYSDRLASTFKEKYSCDHKGMCLAAVKRIFNTVLKEDIPVKNGIGWASKADLDKVKSLVYIGTYDISGSGNISKEALEQGGHLVTQFFKGKEGCQGHIGYNCFEPCGKNKINKQIEYSDGRQLASCSYGKMGGYYDRHCKIYAFSSTKIPTGMAQYIVSNALSNPRKINKIKNASVNAQSDTSVKTTNNHPKTPKQNFPFMKENQRS